MGRMWSLFIRFRWKGREGRGEGEREERERGRYEIYMYKFTTARFFEKKSYVCVGSRCNKVVG